MAKNIAGIDYLKGILIILVIIGHAIYEPLESNQLVYIIYSFHIPLFLGLSGYLMNCSFIKSANFRQLVKKYASRIYFPWLSAWVVYYLIDLNLGIRVFSFPSLIHDFIFPIYHLWYIPALCLYILTFWLAKKAKISTLTILIFSLIISIALTHYWDFFFGLEENLAFLFYLNYKPHFFTFFLFGIWLRELPEMDFKWLIVGSIVGFVLLVKRWFQFNTTAPFFNFNYYEINFLLISAVIPLTSKIKKSISPFIESIGRNSLYFYLWHAVFQYVLFMRGSPP